MTGEGGRGYYREGGREGEGERVSELEERGREEGRGRESTRLRLTPTPRQECVLRGGEGDDGGGGVLGGAVALWVISSTIP